MDNRQQAGDISSLKKQVEELDERLKKLENLEIHHDNRDINDKLSDYALKVAQGSRGPLKSDELIQYFTDDDFGKNKKVALTIFRRFPKNDDGVINQFADIIENIQNRVTYRKKENERDDKLIKKIKKCSKTVEEEQEKERKSNPKPKIQSTMDQYFDKNPQNVSNKNKNLSSKAEAAGKSKTRKRRMRVKEADKENRKRKIRKDDEDDYESCSSPEIEVDQITAKLKKQSIESNSGVFRQCREQTPMINSQSSSEGSDVLSEDDSTEIIKMKKADVKSAEKRCEQLKLRSRENVPEYNGNEETVHEKHLHLRGKQIR